MPSTRIDQANLVEIFRGPRHTTAALAEGSRFPEHSTIAIMRLAAFWEFVVAYAARYVFQCAYDAHRQLTELFDFVAPTAIALWNLRWQVQGFLREVPTATSSDLSSRFAFGSGMRGGEIRRACVDTSWVKQCEQFAELILVSAIASFEDFTAQLAAGASPDEQVQRFIATNLQFPGGSLAIPNAPTRDNAAVHLAVSCPALNNVFTRDARLLRRNAGPKLDNLLLCYRFFKALRNAIAHNGRRINTEVINAYARYQPVETPTDLGIKECPIHDPIGTIGDPIILDLRGVTGLSNVILHIITTYDVDLTATQLAAREIVRRLRSVPGVDAHIYPGDPVKRTKQINGLFKSANLPDVTLTHQLEVLLKSEGILPRYA